MLVADVLAAYLVHNQVAAFGVVGNGNIHMVSAMVEAGGEYTAVRHEAGAVAAADAYYRASGKIAVATTTYGPGFSNALTPLTEAQAARVPLVYVTSDIPTTGARPIDINQRGVLEALGIHHVCLTLDNATTVLAEAFAWARQHSAPAVVMVAHDLCDRVLPEATTEGDAAAAALDGIPLHHPAVPASAAAVSKVATLLSQARRPLFVIGRGAVESGMHESILDIADRIGGLVCTTAWATNSVQSPWNLGIAGGFSHRGRLDLFRSADVVVVCGASLNKLQTRGGGLFGSDATLIRIDSSRSPGGFIRPTHEVHADLADAIPRIVRQLDSAMPNGIHGGLRTTHPTWREDIRELPSCESEEHDPGCFAEVDPSDGRLDPRFVLRRLAELLPSERTIVTDGGHFLGWVPKYLTGPDQHGLIMVGAAIMTIGLGLPSAVGAAVARPERFTALITGDGGCLMAAADAESFLRARETGGHAGRGVIVLNDAAYGAEVHQYSRKGLNEKSMLLEEVDFSQLGAPFGVEGITISRPEQLAEGGELAQFLERQLAGSSAGAAHATSRDTRHGSSHPGPSFVIDIRISRGPVADFLKEL